MSRRPGSGRPQSRTNPITGEEMSFDQGRTQNNYQGDRNVPSRTGAVSRPHSRPQGVPSLNLGRLVDTDDSYHPAKKQDYRLNTPTTASTVSWGTPTGTGRQQYQDYPPAEPQQRQPSYQPAPQVKLPLQKQEKPPVQVPTKLSSDPSTKKITPNAPRLNQSEIAVNVDHLPEDEDVSYLTRQPYSQAQLLKKMDAEELEEERRKLKMIETVMADQLSRFAISDSGQDVRPEPPPMYVGRNQVRTLHESKIRTTGTSTEHLLSQRVRFGARVLTRNGHDALRELTGFFFAVDNTLTLYEFRQFGKSAKSLPFINRGCYNHMTGRRKGRSYNLCDICAGRTLSFTTENQHSLPETLTCQSILFIRITDVDEEAKEKVLVPHVRPSEKEIELEKLHRLSKEEEYDYRMLMALQAQIRSKLKKRGVKTVTGLGAYFRQVDRTGDGTLDKMELQQALKEYRMEIPGEHFDAVWDILDLNGDQVLDYGEFMSGFVGEMNEYRKRLVRKAFQRLDANRCGVVTLSNMERFYSACKHPQVRSGLMSEPEAMKTFLGSWTHCNKQGEVSYVEFEEYYEGMSISIDSDEEFANIIKNTWGL